MIRATTPLHEFVFDVDPEAAFEKILISYAQNGAVILEKEKDDLAFSQGTDGKYVASVRLTQEETRLFSGKYQSPVTVQVRALTYLGEALASEKTTISIENVLNDEVMS